MYAVIENGGKQYSVSKGDVITLEKIDLPVGKTLNIDKVLFIKNKEVILGDPYIKDASVKIEILEQLRDEKVVVFKMKKRKSYRKTQGHRQYITKVKVIDISNKVTSEK